jgi:hypothetical protein
MQSNWRSAPRLSGDIVLLCADDNEHVTRHVCRDLGLDNVVVLTGADIATRMRRS